MTAGVAGVFKHHFGKPKSSNCIHKHLSFQQGENSAALFGLITKGKYFQKPTIDDYNKAFELLTVNFKARKFTRLMCSPMGCVRDGITPEHFAEKIVHFQIATGVPVNIITHHKFCGNKMRNGSVYFDFVTCLKAEIGRLSLKLMPLPQRDKSACLLASSGLFASDTVLSENHHISVSSQDDLPEYNTMELTPTQHRANTSGAGGNGRTLRDGSLCVLSMANSVSSDVIENAPQPILSKVIAKPTLTSQHTYDTHTLNVSEISNADLNLGHVVSNVNNNNDLSMLSGNMKACI